MKSTFSLNSAVAQDLEKISQADKNFNLATFVNNALRAAIDQYQKGQQMTPTQRAENEAFVKAVKQGDGVRFQ